jgi:hypothetical protein
MYYKILNILHRKEEIKMNNIIYLENWHLAPTVITKEQLNMAVGAKLGSALCSVYILDY